MKTLASLIPLVAISFLASCGGNTPGPHPGPDPENDYEIKWVDGDNKVLKTEIVAPGYTPSYDGEAPTKKSSGAYTYTWNGNWSPSVEAACKDITYKAQFDSSVTRCLVTFKDYDGSVIEEKYWDIGSTPSCPTPSREEDERFKYTFKGWDPAITSVSEKAEYRATYNKIAKKYLVTYRNYNGSILKEKFTDPGSMYIYDGASPSGKTYDGNYVDVFDGWDKDVLPVTNASQCYTAKFKKEALTQMSFTVSRTSGDDPFIIEFEVENNNETFTVDWGDDDTEQPKEFTSKASHTYAVNETKVYTVKISKSKKLSSFKFTDELKTHGYEKVTSLNLSNSLTSIPKQAFYKCSGITSPVVIPDSVSSIGESAFYQCTNIPSITCPNKTTSIGMSAFSNCTNLSTLTLNNVISLGSNFMGHTKVSSINIPKSCVSFTHSSFNYCDSVTSLIIDNGNPLYDSRDNCNGIVETSTNKLIRGFPVTNIPSSVTTIGEDAFAYYDNLTNINITEGVKTIERWAFSSCDNLTTVSFPSTLLNIGEYAFRDCKSLAAITLPSKLDSIGQEAFYGCSEDLTVDVTHVTDHVITGGYHMFHEFDSKSDYKILPNLVITVTVARYQDYLQAQYWKTYASHITTLQ